MNTLLIRCSLLAVFSSLATALLAEEVASHDVRAWKDTLTIPTYLVDPPNPMPRFYEGRSHQGVQRHIYPYPMNDGLTTTKQDRTYPIVYVENDYIKLGIMPALGGRIFSAEDKTNHYDFFYRQHVIKPSLIGMVGYWISGSMAWGFPHHHGPNTVKPMDYRVEKNDDGSQTIWIADFDQRSRMRILVGYTVFPRSSIVEMTIRPMNCTPIVNSFLFWANPSVHADASYEVIFPPSVKYVTQHAKHEMTSWPVADRRFNSFDYAGVPINLWKNVGVPSSFFAWEAQEDFFGGYSHAKQAGTVWLGNHHVCPGMKYWAWGNNPGGDKANAALTDADGHYIELMAGAFTDNQPDYSWLQPYESKDVKMVWYPIRNLGGVKCANEHAAANLEIKPDKSASIRINTTRPQRQARVILQSKGKLLLEELVEIAPDRPYAREMALPSSAGNELRLSLVAADGAELLCYETATADQSKEKMPPPLEAPLPPEKIKTVEELYLTGLRLNQFFNAWLDPSPYFNEALKRDPGDYRVNTQLGILYLQRKMWPQAKERLQTAVDRITARYTRARDGEAHYYLGLALRAQGKLDPAYDQFYRASWSYAWHTAAMMQLAEIDCLRGKYITALDHVRRAIATDGRNLKALHLEAYALRKLGRLPEAEQKARLAAERNLLDHRSRNELWLTLSAVGQTAEAEKVIKDLNTIMRDDVQTYLELATDYLALGGYREASDVLLRREQAKDAYPMVYYLLGDCWSKQGNADKALDCFRRASEMPFAWCFPSRTEEMVALREAIRVNPKDAKAWYYLGNLLYELQPPQAIEAWENSRDIDANFYVVHRNLGLAYEEIQHNTAKAVESMEKAMACNSGDPRLLYELDVLYERNKVAPEKRYAMLRANHQTVARRSETLLREAIVAVRMGQYDDALNILQKNFFPQWEGDRELQDAFQDAYVLRGLKSFDRGDYQKALADYQAALSYPMERWGRSRIAQFEYLIGTAYDALGKADLAKIHYQKAVDTPVTDGDRQYAYYQGEAWKKLKREGEANKIFADLLATAQREADSNFFRQFEGRRTPDAEKAARHYLAGLALFGLQRPGEAQAEWRQALSLDPSQVWASWYLAKLEK